MRAFQIAAPVLAALLSASIAGAKTDTDKGGVVYRQPTHSRIRLGGITVGAFYSHFSGPYYGYPYYGFMPYWAYPGSMWGWYDPFWMGFYHPAYWAGFPSGPGTGTVKLPTRSKTAQVFIDGAYAGSAAKIKDMHLEPGAYEIEVREGDRIEASRRVYVLSGKTVQLKPEAQQ